MTIAVERFGQPSSLLMWDSPDERAFCPGASPPDNSCSPTNKGTGRPAPSRPAPDGRVKAGDQRGEVSGHSVEQRQQYYEAVREWAKEMGVSMVEPDLLTLRQDSPMPTMDAIQCVADGLTRLRELGLEPPPEVEIQTIWQEGALAAYDHSTDKMLISADLNVEQQLAAGSWPGDPGWGHFAGETASDIVVHEVAHRDHVAAVGRERFRLMSTGIDQDSEAPADDYDPADRAAWDKSFRVASTAMSSEVPGQPLTRDEAYGVAATVSAYATQSPTEFVAEVRTALFRNPNRNRFPKALFALYEDYGGPPLPEHSRPSKGKKSKGGR
jgi:hypothetical protein